MSCETGSCGLGDWNGPAPGDPDNNLTLSARTVYGGVLVNWSYPLVNDHAVAYTEVYRGTSNDGATAVLLDKWSGSSYLDRVEVVADTEYYYWIEVVSIHGTRGARLGPASAIARPRSVQTLESLTGLIDAGALAQKLKEDIAGISQNNQAIYKEINDRIASNEALQVALAAVQGDLNQALTYINQEITARTDADSAQVLDINAIAAGLNDANAAIVTEREVRVGQNDARVSEISILTTRVDTAEADIVSERQARIDKDNLLVEDYNALYGRMGSAEGAITDIKTLNLDPASALATKLSTLSTDVDGAAAAIQDLDTALTNGTHALASKVSTVESQLNGNVATGQVGLTTEVDELTQTVNSMWYAKVQVNGLIGGFGIHNDGTIVDAGFDVDRFWVGRTGDDKVKPFIIDNGIVYINKAIIKQASIGSLQLAGAAVTVPICVRSSAITKGTGKNQWKSLIKGYIKLDQPGIVYAHGVFSQRYGRGIRYWSMRIKINGVIGSTIGGESVTVAPVIAMSTGLAEGTYPVEIEWWGENDGVYIESAELFIQGAKR